jgi:hypothetical protein
MRELEFLSASGKPYRVSMPRPKAGLRSGFLFSFHKSGSTLMDGMVRTYCKLLGVPTFSLFNAAFDAGVPTDEIQQDAAACFAPEGMIYTGFRHFPNFDLDLTGIPCILLVRDPRDMLVSLYYSVTRSHQLPTGNQAFKDKRALARQMDIDTFVCENSITYVTLFNRYINNLPTETLCTYRYEDVIYEKAQWLRDLAGNLGLPLRRPLLYMVARKYDVIPTVEKQDKHIRQVHPGNYKAKLKPDTIERLNTSLAGFLTHHGYE